MKKTKGIYLVNYFKSFDTSIKINDNVLLDIEVYGIIQETIDKKVDFNILCMNGIKTLYPLGNYTKHLLCAKRVIEATELKIEKNDYCSVIEKDGTYSFVMEEK